MYDIATATLGAVTIDNLIEHAMQNGLWGVVAGLITWGIRSLWAFYKPHVAEALKAKLKRYEATTKLTQVLQETQLIIAEQHRQMLDLHKITAQEARIFRKWVQRVATALEGLTCLARTDVRKHIFDSDDNLETSDDSSGNTHPNPNTR